MLALVVLAVSSVPPAHADRLGRAKAIASRVWHDPCAGHVAVEFGVLPPEGAAEAIAWALDETCEIGVSGPQRTLVWYELCTYMIHEYGHLAGYRDWTNSADPIHSSSPNSVMVADVFFLEGAEGGRPVVYGADRRCYNRGRPYLGMPAARYPMGWL